MSTLANLLVELGLDNNKFMKGVGESNHMLRNLGIATVGLGIVAGAALFKVGSDWDAATDTIITKTGATGDALTELQNVTKHVFKSIPTDMQTAADAVSLLSTKTDATGKNLDSLAQSEIELARITKTDLTGNIEASAKIFNVFGVAAKDQTKTLDGFFRASQKTGVGVDQLMAEVEQFSPVLKAMGLGADASALLIGKLDKAGLHTNQIMMGLKKSLTVFAKAGISDVHGGLTTVFNDIKNAGSSATATATAVKYFGAKAGPELAQAIREGTISVEDLTGAVDENGDSILDTAAKTNDFTENFKIFKNNVEAALIPLGSLVFGGLNLLVPLLILGVDALSRFGAAMGDAFDTSQEVSTIVQRFPGFLQPVVAVFLQVADAIGDVVRAYEKGGFKGMLDAIPGAIGQVLGSLKDLATQLISITIDGAIELAGDLWDAKGNLFPWLVGQLLGSDAKQVAEKLTFTQALSLALDGAMTLAGDLVDAAGRLWDWVLGKLLGGDSGAGSATGAATAVGSGGFSFTQALGLLLDGAIALAGDIYDMSLDAAGWLWDKIVGAWDYALPIFTATLNALVNLGGDLAGLRDDAAGWIKAAIDWTGEKSIYVAKLTIYAPTEVHATGGDDAAPGRNWVQKVVDGIEATGLMLWGAAKWIVSSLGTFIGYSLGLVAGAAVTLIATFILGIYTAITNPSSIMTVVRGINDLLFRAEDAFIAGAAKLFDLYVMGIIRGFADSFMTATPDELTTGISDLITRAINAITDAATWMLWVGVDVLAGFASGVLVAWELFKTWFTDLPGSIQELVGNVLDGANSLVQKGTDLLQGMWDGALDKWETFKNVWTNLPTWIFNAMGKVSKTLKSKGVDLIVGLANGAQDQFDEMRDWVEGIPSDVLDSIGAMYDVGSILSGVGDSIIRGLAGGISGAEHYVTNAVNAIIGHIPATIRHLMGIGSPAKAMIPLGKYITQGVAVGIEQGIPHVTRAMGSVADALPRAMSTSFGATLSPMGAAYSESGANGGGSSGPVVHGGIHITVEGSGDPDAVADRVFAKFSRELSLAGAA